MKPITLLAPLVAVLGLLSAAPAMSQTQEGKPAATRSEPQQSESKRPAAMQKRSRRNLDARECLKHPTNMEIHRCSLRFL